VHVSGHLNPGGQQFRTDHGGAGPRVAAALAAYLAGQGSEQAALQALAASRLLVPVIAVLTEGTTPQHGDKNSEMVMPTLIGNDGRPAVLAFTSLDALTRWRPDARPVPAEADRVWRAAVADGCAVVIDVAGPVPLAVEGARLAALAAGQPVPPPHEDPDIHAAVRAAIAGEPGIAGFTLAPGRADADGRKDGTDLTITLQLTARSTARSTAQSTAEHDAQTANRAAASIAGRLAGRLRRGIEVSRTG
jgi:SseB protein N-terminal domain